MDYRIAFAGFRHPHITDMYRRSVEADGLSIVAACEEDAETRAVLEAAGQIRITHRSFASMVREVEFEVLAIGDYFRRRGSLILAGLQAGKHVISDKPICTQLSELEAIGGLVEGGGAVLGAMLDLRDSGIFRRVRELVRGGEVGPVHSISFNGGHPLLLPTRPRWYFEEGKQGGTINDLGIHAFDAIPWITGGRWHDVVAAREWDAGGLNLGGFCNASQVMLSMEDGCGVVGELCYLVPDSFGYRFPGYWRFVFTGERGIIEAGLNSPCVRVYREGESEVREVPPLDPTPGGYLASFIREIEGRSLEGDLTTGEVLSASRMALRCQAAAQGAGGIGLPREPAPGQG